MVPASEFPVAYLVLTNVAREDWCEAVDQRRKVIGRSEEADIRVPRRFQHVSRRHAEIWADRNGIRLRDLHSKCGTHINGVWIKEHREACVTVGDRIWMGGLELKVVEDFATIGKVLAEVDIGSESMADDDTFFGRDETLPLPPKILLAMLTPAELEIVLWMGRGYCDDEELGKILHRSPHTIRTHFKSIFRKLNINSRSEITGFLKRHQ